MRQNKPVCFEMDTDHELYRGATPCEGTMKYKNIVGYGLLELVGDPKEKKKE